MSNLYEIQRNRMKLYGEMVRNDMLQRKKSQLLEKQERRKRDSQELQQHIQNTKRFELTKRQELKDLSHSLREDNLFLSSLKHSLNAPYSQEDTRDLMKEIHEHDLRRADRHKRELCEQNRDNSSQVQSQRFSEERQREVEREEEERHKNRTREVQLDSIRNYEEIKRKHQQNMSLFEAHKQLVEQNDKYRSEVQAFTNVDHGLLGRYNRNDYLERRAALSKNQEAIRQQMQELERRKHQQTADYKQSLGDLQHSMLKSVLVKPERHEAKAYSLDLRSQMNETSLRKNEQQAQKKQRLEINNIYGGVHGREREKMIKIVDNTLGLGSLERTKTTNSGYLDIRAKAPQPTSNARLNNPQQNTCPPHLEHPTAAQQAYAVAGTRGKEQKNYQRSPESSSNTSRRYYKSFDPISVQNRLYAAQ